MCEIFVNLFALEMQIAGQIPAYRRLRLSYPPLGRGPSLTGCAHRWAVVGGWVARIVARYVIRPGQGCCAPVGAWRDRRVGRGAPILPGSVGSHASRCALAYPHRAIQQHPGCVNARNRGALSVVTVCNQYCVSNKCLTNCRKMYVSF